MKQKMTPSTKAALELAPIENRHSKSKAQLMPAQIALQPSNVDRTDINTMAGLESLATIVPMTQNSNASPSSKMLNSKAALGYQSSTVDLVQSTNATFSPNTLTSKLQSRNFGGRDRENSSIMMQDDLDLGIG